MQVETKKVKEVFKKLTGLVGELEIPTGVYDASDPGDAFLQSLVPHEDPNYLFPGPTVIALLVAMQERDNVLLHGATGVGKSMVVMQLAHKLGLPLTRVNFQGDMGSPEVFGYFGLPDPNIPGDNGWKWTSITLGIQRPGIILLDEWDAIRAEVGIGLQRLLEDHDPGLFLSERDEFIPRHPDCVVMATANTKGLGDPTGLYAGTGLQNYAQLNRFHVIMEVEPLEPDKLEVILRKANFGGAPLTDKLIEALVKFYSLTLNAHAQEKLSAPVSIRAMLHFARYFRLIGNGALELVLLSKLASDEERAAVRGFADRVGLLDGTPKEPVGATP